jgi:uncharacterized protein
VRTRFTPVHHTECSFNDKLCALSRPTAYPHGCEAVSSIETHFAAVFLTGEFAYKLKKPVQVERMDFRELAAREHTCREELRLNRRLAAEVYLSVEPLTREADGTLRVSGSGEIVDWLVKMRALPADRMLDCAIAANAVTRDDLKSAAQLLACFYRDQPPIEFTGPQYLRRLRERVDDVREQLLANDLALEVEGLDATIKLQREFLHDHAQSVEERACENRIVEGHGDLRPEHIFLGAQPLAPCIIDCLEFDRDLRIFDPLEELAFLTLECERLNAAWIGREFIEPYREIVGDEFPPPLFDFYRRQRALTRAKIAAWHLRDPTVAHIADWRALTASYVRDALQTA